MGQDLIDNVVSKSDGGLEKKPKIILKPITLKVHNVQSGVKKVKKPKFKVIRVSATAKPKFKRSGSGLDLNDYKGKRRRKNKQKKLDKLIIRNISSLSQMVSTAPPNATNICSTILDKTIKNLPCFQNPSPNYLILMLLHKSKT